MNKFAQVEFVLSEILFPFLILTHELFELFLSPCIVNRGGVVERPGGHLATSPGQSPTQHENVNTYHLLKRKEESHEGSEAGKRSKVESFINLQDYMFFCHGAIL